MPTTVFTPAAVIRWILNVSRSETSAEPSGRNVTPHGTSLLVVSCLTSPIVSPPPLVVRPVTALLAGETLPTASLAFTVNVYSVLAASPPTVPAVPVEVPTLAPAPLKIS